MADGSDPFDFSEFGSPPSGPPSSFAPQPARGALVASGRRSLDRERPDPQPSDLQRPARSDRFRSSG
jgi:hypothetical protein